MGRQLFIIIILSISFRALAGITIQTSGSTPNGSGFSNVIQPAATPAASGPSLYYSNIGVSDGTNWNPAGGGPCNPQVNPNCLVPTATFNFQAQDTVTTSGAPQFYVLFSSSGTAPTAGSCSPIGNCGTVVMTFPYNGPNTWGTTQMTFGGLCAGLAPAVSTIDAQCNQIASGAGVYQAAQVITLYIVADANGNAAFDSGEDVLSFNFVIQSGIPVSSSISSAVGLWGFQTYPGDSQVLLTQLQGGSDVNTQSGNQGAGVQYARFYYVTGPDVYSAFNVATFQNINADGAAPATTVAHSDIPLTTSNTLQTPFINGLSNLTSYYFRSALIDNAGNIGFITPSTDDNPPGAAAPLVMHAAEPDEIAGLLSKNGNCFIATAAYGSPWADEVHILREFRDKVLMKTSFGQRFVYWYYRNGSPWAERIRNRDDIRSMVRGALYPIVGFSWLALKIGAYNACLLLVTLLLFPFLIWRFYKGVPST